MENDAHISSYAQIVHTLFVEGTLDYSEVEGWMDDMGLEILECNEDKISFTYMEGFIHTKMTIFSSGKVFIDSGFEK